MMTLRHPKRPAALWSAIAWIALLTSCDSGTTGLEDANVADGGIGGVDARTVADLLPDGPAADRPECTRYLSCLLAIAPQSYAAALVLYGEKAVCWDTAQQSANCETACLTAFERIADNCICSAQTCVGQASYTLREGRYAATKAKVVLDDCQIASYFGSAAYDNINRIDGGQLSMRLAVLANFASFAVSGEIRADAAELKESATSPAPFGITMSVRLTADDRFSALLVFFDGGGYRPCQSKVELELERQ